MWHCCRPREFVVKILHYDSLARLLVPCDAGDWGRNTHGGCAYLNVTNTVFKSRVLRRPVLMSKTHHHQHHRFIVFFISFTLVI